MELADALAPVVLAGALVPAEPPSGVVSGTALDGGTYEKGSKKKGSWGSGLGVAACGSEKAA